MSRLFNPRELRCAAFPLIILLTSSLVAQDQATTQASEQDESARPRQEDESTISTRGRGQRGRNRGRGPVITEEMLGPIQRGSRGGAGGRGGAPFDAPRLPPLEVQEDDGGTELIGVNIWALSISAPAQINDELIADLISRARTLQVTLGSRHDVNDWVTKLSVAGVLERSREFRLTAVSGQSANLQDGANVPQVTGTSITQFGSVNSVAYQPVGTVVQVQPRIDPDGKVRIAFSYSASEIEPRSDVFLSESREGERMRASQVVNQQLQSTIRLPSGSAALVHSLTNSQLRGDSPGLRMQLVIISAETIAD
jgi:hypothetical protein